MTITATLLPGVRWCAAKDGDPRAFALRQRHYTARPRPAITVLSDRKIAGPGESLVLLAPQSDAVFVWRAERHRKDGQVGINCGVFRNESPWRSSDLIREACALAWARWPGERLYTFVNPRKLPYGKRPGYCFECAGWQRLTKRSQGGLLILEVLP
jgi:hypothetical protein